MSSIEIFEALEQGSAEWFEARMGRPTASEFSTILAKGKDGGTSVTRTKYLNKLAGEILTEEPAPEGYTNGFMERGHELEDEARRLFAFLTDLEPRQVGFVRHLEHRAGCSPDSLIGEDSGLEIKVAIPAVQIERLKAGRLPPEHVAQVQGSMWITERPTWRFMSYCPKLPPLMLTIRRDEDYIAKLASAVAAFNDELDALVASIRSYSDLKGQLAA